MTFEELLDQVLALLQRRGRVAYRVVQRQFDLDDATFEDVKDALFNVFPISSCGVAVQSLLSVYTHVKCRKRYQGGFYEARKSLEKRLGIDVNLSPTSHQPLATNHSLRGRMRQCVT